MAKLYIWSSIAQEWMPVDPFLSLTVAETRKAYRRDRIATLEVHNAE